LVENLTSQAVTVELQVVEFTINPETGAPELGQPASPSLVKITAPQTGQLELGPRQKGSADLTITTPSAHPAQEYHWAVIALQKQELTTGDGIQTQVTGGIASNLVVLVSPGDTVSSALQIAKFELPALADTFLPFSVKMWAHNPGFQAQPASGSAVLKDSQGQTLLTQAIYPDMVLAGTTRPLRASNPEASHSAEPTRQFVFKKPGLVGLYTIGIFLENNGDVIELPLGRVVILPWLVIALALGGIGIFVLTQWLVGDGHLKQILSKVSKSSSVSST
jgi:hypothetical protein